MANCEVTYLSLDKVNGLLPDNLKIDLENRLERSVYKTVEGKPLPIIYSKLYSQNYYWYSCVTSFLKQLGCEIICFTSSNYGVLVIPIEVVLHYNKSSRWKYKYKKGRQYHVRIKYNANDVLTF